MNKDFSELDWPKISVRFRPPVMAALETTVKAGKLRNKSTVVRTIVMAWLRGVWGDLEDVEQAYIDAKTEKKADSLEELIKIRFKKLTMAEGEGTFEE